MNLIRRNRKGIGLVEVMVAMVLVAILLWPMINNFMSLKSLTMKTGDVMLGTNLCRQVMEILRNKSFKTLLVDGPAGDPLLEESMNEEAIRELVKKTLHYEGTEFKYYDERFKRTVTITPKNSITTMKGEEPMFVEIIVYCEWITRDAKGRGELTLCSLVANEAARPISE
jgi:type II secretory pathway pseudopilin PulG